jgi:hypothetical protein
MTQKTTLTLPAGTVLTTTKAVDVGGHHIEASTEVTLGAAVTVTLGDKVDNELPEGGKPEDGPGQGQGGAQPKTSRY